MDVAPDVDEAILTTKNWLDKYGPELTNDEFRSVSTAIYNLNAIKEIVMGTTPCCDREKTRGPNVLGDMVCPSHCSRCGHERRAEDYLGFCSECQEGEPCANNKRSSITPGIGIMTSTL